MQTIIRKNTYTKFLELINRYSLFLILLFGLLINLDQLQIFRNYAIDEVTMADTSYSIFMNSPVPASKSWSHIFQTQKTIDFQYTPLYFYVAGFFMKLVGFSPLAIGTLHLFARLAALIALYFFLYRSGLTKIVALLIGLCWASFLNSTSIHLDQMIWLLYLFC